MTLRELENILINLSVDASLMYNPQHSMVVSNTMSMLKSIENLSSTILLGQLNDTCKSMMLQKMAEFETYVTQAVFMRFNEMGIDISMCGAGMGMGMGAGMGMGGMGSGMGLGMMGMGGMGMSPTMMPPVVTSQMGMPMQRMQPIQSMTQPMQPQMQTMQPQMQTQVAPAPAPVEVPAPAVAPPAAPVPEPTPPAAPIAAPPPPPKPVAATPPPPAEPVVAALPSSSGLGGGISMGGSLPGMGGGKDEAAEGRDYLLKIINGEA